MPPHVEVIITGAGPLISKSVIFTSSSTPRQGAPVSSARYFSSVVGSICIPSSDPWGRRRRCICPATGSHLSRVLPSTESQTVRLGVPSFVHSACTLHVTRSRPIARAKMRVISQRSLRLVIVRRTLRNRRVRLEAFLEARQELQ